MNDIHDHIISGKTGEIFAEIIVRQNANNSFMYEGEIATNNFPPGFVELLNEYQKNLDDRAFGVLDGIEKKIYSYIPMLRNHKLKLFDLSIDGSKISFLTKYPTGKGYLDEFPL